jgi:hypothetical protein
MCCLDSRGEGGSRTHEACAPTVFRTAPVADRVASPNGSPVARSRTSYLRHIRAAPLPRGPRRGGAEEVGFEPTPDAVPVCLSGAVPSTSRPPFPVPAHREAPRAGIEPAFPLIQSQGARPAEHLGPAVRRPYGARTRDLLTENQVSCQLAPTVHEARASPGSRMPSTVELSTHNEKAAPSLAGGRRQRDRLRVTRATCPAWSHGIRFRKWKWRPRRTARSLAVSGSATTSRMTPRVDRLTGPSLRPGSRYRQRTFSGPPTTDGPEKRPGPTRAGRASARARARPWPAR